MIILQNKPTIIVNKVILRPFEISDIELMEECLKDPEVIKFTGSSDNLDNEIIRKWYSSRNEQTNRLDLAIIERYSEYPLLPLEY